MQPVLLLTKKRDYRFDLLRVLGLICIFLAHVSPPAIIKQLRNFDVPLMVIVSGAAFGLSTNNKFIFSTYYKKRTLRLLAPTWAFLSFFFLYAYFIHFIRNKAFPFSIDKIIDSFLLLDGIGYVWIIRIFLLMIIVAPFFIWLAQKLKNKFYYLIGLLVIWGFYEFINYFLTHITFQSNLLNVLTKDFLLYILPYGVLFGLGIILPSLKKKETIYICTISFFVFIIMMIFYIKTHRCFLTQYYKYPPQLYYVSYATASSLLLYLLTAKLHLTNTMYNTVLFLTSSTMWLYLWHIFILYNWSWCIKYIPQFFNFFPIKLSIVLLLSIIITLTQKKIITATGGYTNNKTINAILNYCFLK